MMTGLRMRPWSLKLLRCLGPAGDGPGGSEMKTLGCRGPGPQAGWVVAGGICAGVATGRASMDRVQVSAARGGRSRPTRSESESESGDGAARARVRRLPVHSESTKRLVP